MRKLLFFIAFVAFGMNVQAQNSTLKTSPGALAFGVFNACYEKRIRDNTSFQVSAAVLFKTGDLNGTAAIAYAGYRKYISKKEAPRGLYLMPQTGFSIGEKASTIILGFDLGYQWVWDSAFVLDMGLGPSYYFKLDDDNIAAFDGLAPNFVLAIGYAF